VCQTAAGVAWQRIALAERTASGMALALRGAINNGTGTPTYRLHGVCVLQELAQAPPPGCRGCSGANNDTQPASEGP
jgi:hypothetical protein